jgi:hypothetical protein
MKRYTKEINGKSVVMRRRDIIIHKDGKMVFSPTEEMLIADGWGVYVAPQPTDEQMLKQAVASKVRAIEVYDTSSEVNEFYVRNIPVWLDKATRAGLLLRFQAEQAQGLEDTTLWYNGMQFPLKVDQAIEMLFAIELYASACYDNTQRHLAAISNLATIEEIKSYDYTQGYPEKLRF